MGHPIPRYRYPEGFPASGLSYLWISNTLYDKVQKLTLYILLFSLGDFLLLSEHFWSTCNFLDITFRYEASRSEVKNDWLKIEYFNFSSVQQWMSRQRQPWCPVLFILVKHITKKTHSEGVGTDIDRLCSVDCLPCHTCRWPHCSLISVSERILWWCIG